MKLKIALASVAVLCLSSTFALAENHSKNLDQKDKDALSWVIVLNKNEISAGQETLKKVKNPQIKDFAHKMVKEHTENLKQAKSYDHNLAKDLAKTDDVSALQQQGKDEMQKLSTLKGKDYEVVYIDMMVDDHTAALKKLEDDYIASANNPKVKKYLEATAKHVKTHLEEAKTIQDTLKS